MAAGTAVANTKNEPLAAKQEIKNLKEKIAGL